MLNIGPIDILPRKLQVDLDRFPGVVRVPYDQTANDVHFVFVEIIDGFYRGVTFTSIFTLCVLGSRAQERKIVFQDVLNTEQDVSQSGPAHYRSERVAAI